MNSKNNLATPAVGGEQKLFPRIRKQILDCLFPIECLGCGQAGTWYCEKCLGKLSFQATQICFACRQATAHGEFCLLCRHDYDLDGIFCAGNYDDPPLAILIKKFKFYGLKDLRASLSDFLIKALLPPIEAWPEFLTSVLPNLAVAERTNFWKKYLESQPLLVPLPLSRRRQAWRGYNQAELLAQTLAPRLGLELSTDLKKLKNTAPQAKLKEAERLTNLRNCFAWSGPNLERKNLILIDDIATTGATLNEAAKTLKLAGAGHIWGLVLAKG